MVQLRFFFFRPDPDFISLGPTATAVSFGSFPFSNFLQRSHFFFFSPPSIFLYPPLHFFIFFSGSFLHDFPSLIYILVWFPLQHNPHSQANTGKKCASSKRDQMTFITPIYRVIISITILMLFVYGLIVRVGVLVLLAVAHCPAVA